MRPRWGSGASPPEMCAACSRHVRPLLASCVPLACNFLLRAGVIRYIVCATGKSAEEMLAILQNRLNNTPEEELVNGAAEQNKITHLRLNKLLSELTSSSL